MSLEEIVIENIKKIRKEKHITQERLAEYCNTSVSYIGLMETYKNIPKLSTIERIAEALNVPVLELFKSPDSEDNEKKSNDKLIDKKKQKLRKQVKKDILERLSPVLEEVLQII